MGLFSRPKISEEELQMVSAVLNQAHDTVKLINTTVNPKVFFKRLNFFLDILLFLQRYEKYKILKGTAPSEKYKQIIENMNNIVNDFIDRSSQDCANKMAALKTNKAKLNRFADFAVKLISAFDCAHTFWEGNNVFPHYTGPLYTKSNYERAQLIFDESCLLEYEEISLYPFNPRAKH